MCLSSRYGVTLRIKTISRGIVLAAVMCLSIALLWILLDIPIDNGNYEGHIVTSCSGRQFYHSIPGFALECDDDMRQFFMTEDYRHAEVSYKGAVSFYLGMIGARFFYDKFLAGWASGYQLLHAGDSEQFVLTQASGKSKTLI